MAGSRVRHIVGCMTGTSLDGLDAALVRVEGEGLEMTATPLGQHALPLGTLNNTLRALATAGEAGAKVFASAGRALGELHAQAVEQLLRRHPNVTLDFVAAHGQTILHEPGEHLSWQLFDPWPVARRLGVPVVYDLRQADLVAGGQGAPVTPISDWVMFRSADEARMVVNLGGVCNVTVLPAGAPPDRVLGGDVGPCNLLLDGLTHALVDRPFDEDGRLARGGRVDAVLCDALVLDARAGRDLSAQHSMGRETFGRNWLASVLERSRHLQPGDVLASAVESIAWQVELVRAQWCDGPCTVVLAGGGAKNPVLVDRITARCAQGGAPVTTSDTLGVPIDAREAMAFAVLGALCQDRVPITLPRVTGATQPGVAGAWVGF